jgi:hypothetical protein
MVQLVILSLLQQMPGFEHRPVLVEFEMGRVTLGQVFLLAFWSPIYVGIIPPVLCTHLFIYNQCYIIVAVDSIIK